MVSPSNPKNCKKGWPCGNTCISKKKGCFKNLRGGLRQEYTDYLALLASKRAKAKKKAETPPEIKTPPPEIETPPPEIETPQAEIETPPKKAKKKAKKATPVSKDNVIFPSSLEELEFVKSLGGSTGADLMRAADGTLFVRKRGANAEHLQSEMAADAIYRALGVPVPEYQEYKDENGKPVKLARYIEGRRLSDLSEPERQAAYQKLQEHFAVDALLGNWDVVGLNADNVVVDAGGTPWRVDNGGALAYRAQGEKKPKDGFDKYPTALFSLRDGRASAATRQAFGTLTNRQVAEQVLNIRLDDFYNATASLPQNQRYLLVGRLDEARGAALAIKALTDDRFNDVYAGRFAESGLELARAGVFEKLSSSLKPKQSGHTSNGVLVDNKGVPFDNLRGEDGASQRFYKFLATQNLGGDAYEPYYALSGHSKASNNVEASLVRVWLEGKRQWGTESLEEYMAAKSGKQVMEQYAKMSNDSDFFKKELPRVKSPTYDRAMTFQHAFTYGILTRIKVGNRTPDGRIILTRTETMDAINSNGFKPGETLKGRVRRRLESTSAISVVQVHGSKSTFFALPPHRIFATYFQGKPYSKLLDNTAFMSDSENEFLAIIDDAPTYLAPKGYAEGETIASIIKKREYNIKEA